MDKLINSFPAIKTDTEEIILPQRKIRAIASRSDKCAEAVNLVYVNDKQPGITRIKKGKGFSYADGKKIIIDRSELTRIKKLVIPPAWQKVWICKLANGHLQVTGYDTLNRKQYKYHSSWNSLRNQTKFFRLQEFGKLLPQMRQQIEKDLSLPGLPLEKVLATVVSLMERTTIRVGNSSYEKLYGSFGLTTLKDKHVDIQGSQLKFSFKGKKGIYHCVTTKSKRLANIVKKCRDIPGKELFQYYDHEGNAHSIDSGMVNEYIKKISSMDYTSKDFRTWAGTVHTLWAFKEIGFAETDAEAKKKIIAAMDMVSKHLGNTRSICRKYYVHPVVISLYETNDLQKYLDEIEQFEKEDKISGLTAMEKTLMRILELKSFTKNHKS